MTHRIEIKRSALKELVALPLEVRQRIDRAIGALAANPRAAGTTKLTGADDLYRLRVGDYRIVYQVHDRVLLVVVVTIGHRRQVYRGR